MKAKNLVVAMLAALGASSASAALVDLNGLGYVTYGDGNSYSLAVANYFACGKEYGPGCPYNVKGSPGASETDPRIYIVQGAGGHIDNENANIDDAFDAANNELFFTMTSANEPGSDGNKNATFTGDKTNTWDATLGALDQSFDFSKNLMTFFFVNNEPNSNDGLTQNLAVWARVTLTNLAGTTVYKTFDVTNDPRTSEQRDGDGIGDLPAPGYGPPPVGGVSRMVTSRSIPARATPPRSPTSPCRAARCASTRPPARWSIAPPPAPAASMRSITTSARTRPPTRSPFPNSTITSAA